MRAARNSFLAALAATACFTPAGGAEQEQVYSRVTILEYEQGSIAFRKAYSHPLELLEFGEATAKDPSEPERPTRVDTYGQIYGFEVVWTHTEVDDSGIANRSQIPKGKIAVAIDLAVESEATLEAELEQMLQAITPESLARNFADLQLLSGPFPQSRRAESALPFWLCMELDDKFSFQHFERVSTGYTGRSRGHDDAREPCTEIFKALGAGEPDWHEPAPTILSQERIDVFLERIAPTLSFTWASSLAVPPDRSTYKKQVLTGDRTGSMRHFREDLYLGHEGRYHGVERDAEFPLQASISVAGFPMWLQLWTVRRQVEQFGLSPTTTPAGDEQILAALVPIADPQMPELVAAKLPLFIPEDELFKSISNRMTSTGELPGRFVELGLNQGESWPAQGEWMTIVCRDDGNASYGIAPFAATASITNADEVCSSLRARLEDR